VPKPVRVTKVTVEYAAGGKTFTVVFDPKHVDSIVLNETDLKRLQAKQDEVAKSNPAVKKVDPKRKSLNALAPIPPTHPIDGDRSFASNNVTAFQVDLSEPLSPTTTRGLWWHTDECGWFHPEDQ